jgi:hypothetical protein
MPNSHSLFVKSLFIVILAVSLSSCSEDETGASGAGTGGGGIIGTPIDDVPVGEVENTGFWINMKSQRFPTYVNNQDGWGNPCFIDAEATSNQFMECFIDILEGDLYAYEVGIQYNAPPDLCTHVIITPAWHWNYAPGFGPTAITINLDVDGNVTSCTANDEGNTSPSCAANPEVTLNGTQPICAYDHSQGGLLDRPNCCFGSYTSTLIQAIEEGGTYTEVTNEQWNDPENVSNCIGGPLVVRSNWGNWQKSGYPAGIVIPVGLPGASNQGVNADIKLAANATSVVSNFSYQANFYSRAGDPHRHGSYANPAATLSNLPYAVDPIDDYDQSPFGVFHRGVNLRRGNPAWGFSCLDGAFEVKHHIDVYIREWNTLAAFLAYEESEGATYNPDVDGDEGGECEYDSIFGTTCNDFRDLDNMIPDPILGGYETGPAVSPAIRNTYFPRIEP